MKSNQSRTLSHPLYLALTPQCQYSWASIPQDWHQTTRDPLRAQSSLTLHYSTSPVLNCFCCSAFPAETQWRVSTCHPSSCFCFLTGSGASLYGPPVVPCLSFPGDHQKQLNISFLRHWISWTIPISESILFAILASSDCSRNTYIILNQIDEKPFSDIAPHLFLFLFSMNIS